MQHYSYLALSASLVDLNRAQIDKVSQALNALRHKLDSFSALSGNDPTSCRHCYATKLVRFGFQNGLQRFVCKSCSKTCCATTGTPLARLSGKHQLAGYADCMSKGLTLRQTCAELSMSLDRAFRWRHRMLQNPIDHQPKAIKGILEVDETNFKKSRKGERGLGAGARKRLMASSP